jgi:NAD(P)H-flavin reductase/hemoglobin-like flavoprotein
MAIALDGGRPDSSPDGAGQKDQALIANRHLRFPSYPSGPANTYSGLSIVSNANATPAPIARTNGQNTARKEAERAVTAADLDPRLVKETFAPVLTAGPAAMKYFYARLFATSPDIRGLFPTSMTELREHAFAALAKVVWSLDSQPGCAEILGQLGRDHRRFGVLERHHRAFFAALRDTVKHFIGSAWTAETKAAWQVALDYISATMRAAAEEDAKTSPAWWIAEIVSHELRSPGVAVLRLEPSEALSYQAGQYVPVQVTRWPRAWRPYSIANAPRPGGPIELHVRAVPGGLVSNSLVHHSVTGDCVILGAAAGGMTLAESDRDLLCVAGGTGLAPIKAIIEQALATPVTTRLRKITLFVGARQHFDLYDLEDLQLLESACPTLRVIPVLSDEPGYTGLTGMLPDMVSRHGLFENTEAYVCGPAAMVSQATALLAASIPAGQIHHDPLP